MTALATTRSMLKSAATRALTAPVPYAALRRACDPGRGVTILVYHTLGADDEDMDAWTVLRARDFRRQMEVLREHYDIVSLDDALSGALRSGRPQVVLTFDDGEAGLHRHLMPIVEELRLPVTIYVATRQIESGEPYWFDRVMNALQVAAAVTLELGLGPHGPWHLDATTGAATWRTVHAVLELMKRQTADARQHTLAAIERATAGVPKRRVDPLAPLTHRQLQEIAASPYVTIGAHSHCHSLLDSIPLAEAGTSICRSKTCLEAWLGRPVSHFAYPNGNWNDAVAQLVADAGFASATILEHRLWGRTGSPHTIPRIPIGRYDSLERFKLRLLGF
jgi:peptidoglycan/xylan/chitin deacetylase (PgdA/CDA1 family)